MPVAEPYPDSLNLNLWEKGLERNTFNGDCLASGKFGKYPGLVTETRDVICITGLIGHECGYSVLGRKHHVAYPFTSLWRAGRKENQFFKGIKSVNHHSGNSCEWGRLPLNLCLLELPPKAGFFMSVYSVSFVSRCYLLSLGFLKNIYSVTFKFCIFSFSVFFWHTNCL